MEDKLLTIEEVAEYLRLSKETVYVMVRQGKIPGFKVSNKWRFPLDSLRKWQFRSSGDPGVAEMGMADTEWAGAPAYLAVLNNVTERKQAEELLKKQARDLEEANEKLRELDRMKSEFVSTISHELRIPLQHIQGAISNLLDGIAGELKEKQIEYLVLADRNVARLTCLIDDILGLSRLEAGRGELNKKWVNIATIAENVIFSLRSQLISKKIILHQEYPKDLPPVYADSEKISQVFTNILWNAIKFTGEKGKITVSIRSAGGAIKLSIADNGRGIPPEDLNKIFSKFYQVGRTYGPGSKGTGLGLAISKGIVKMHGGKIWAESEGLEKGSRFFFTLPIGTAQSEAGSKGD
jgi:excisionase family DNA binding protein